MNDEFSKGVTVGVWAEREHILTLLKKDGYSYVAERLMVLLEKENNES